MDQWLEVHVHPYSLTRGRLECLLEYGLHDYLDEVHVDSSRKWENPRKSFILDLPITLANGSVLDEVIYI